MKDTSNKKPPTTYITPPSNFQHIHHIDRHTPLEEVIDAFSRPLTPIDNYEDVPLPRKASSPSTEGRGTMPRGTVSSKSSLSIFGTLSSKGKTRSDLSDVFPTPSSDVIFTDHLYLVPISKQASEEVQRTQRSATDSYALQTIGYVNVKEEKDGYENVCGDTSNWTSSLKRNPPPRPSPPAVKYGTLPSRTVTMSSATTSTVVFRTTPTTSPSGTIAVRDSVHETTKDTVIAAPSRITVTLDRPDGLFGSPFQLPSLGLDQVVPIPSSLESGISEPLFPAPMSFSMECRESTMEDSKRMSGERAKRPAPPPPEEEKSPVTPVPKPRTKKMPQGASSPPLQLLPDKLVCDTKAKPQRPPPPALHKEKEANNNGDISQLDPAHLKLEPARSQLARAVDNDEDFVVTRL